MTPIGCRESGRTCAWRIAKFPTIFCELAIWLAAAQSILLGVIVAALIAVLAAPRASSRLHMIGASPEVIRSGHRFTQVMLGGNV